MEWVYTLLLSKWVYTQQWVYTHLLSKWVYTHSIGNVAFDFRASVFESDTKGGIPIEIEHK